MCLCECAHARACVSLCASLRAQHFRETRKEQKCGERGAAARRRHELPDGGASAAVSKPVPFISRLVRAGFESDGVASATLRRTHALTRYAFVTPLLPPRPTAPTRSPQATLSQRWRSRRWAQYAGASGRVRTHTKEGLEWRPHAVLGMQARSAVCGGYPLRVCVYVCVRAREFV